MSKPDDALVLYEPLPAQLKFHESMATMRLYGGAAGGGKSKALRMEVLNQCLCAPQLNALFLRRTFAELEASIIRPFQNELPVGYYQYHEQKHLMTFMNGSTIKFSHCQHEHDVSKHQGIEYDLIAVDELPHFTEYQFKYLLSRLRTTKKTVIPNFIASGNPGGIGHAFVKRLWIDRDFGEKETPKDFEFIPARVYDNFHLTGANPEYVKLLESLPEKERRALLDGDWNVFDGQFFREFRTDLHVIDPVVPKAEHVKRRIIALDYGYFAPSCVLWLALLTDDQIICYRELYTTEHTYGQLAAKIKAMTRADEEIHTVYADPAIVNKRNEATGTTGSDEFAKQGLVIVPAENARLDGWQTLRQAIRLYDDPNSRKKESRLKITRNCTNLIRTLPQLQHDKRNVEDLDTKGEDHAADALRYGVKALWSAALSISGVRSLNAELKRSKPDYLRTDW